MALFQKILQEASKVLTSETTVLDKTFFEKNFKKILLAVILLLSYIQLRYEYEDRLLSIGRLKAERNDVRYTCIEKWSTLTKENRPEHIRESVARSSVHLIESDERPVIIK